MRRLPVAWGNQAMRVAAAVAFWAAAVLFVANVSLLSGWLLADTAVAVPPAPTESPAPTAEPSESPVPAESPTVTSQPTDDGPITVELAGGAEITFPLSPTESEHDIEVGGVDTPSTQHTVTDAQASTYTVGSIEYPVTVDVSDPAVNLLASASGAAGSAGGQITEQDVTVYDGAAAVEFEIETASVTVIARYVLDGRRLYATSVAYRGENPPVDAQLFLDSLRLSAAP